MQKLYLQLVFLPLLFVFQLRIAFFFIMRLVVRFD